jgi:transposase
MVHRDQDHQSKQLILGNIVQALVERTFAWLSRFRRLARDFERYARTVAAFIHLAMIRIMLKRLVASSSS